VRRAALTATASLLGLAVALLPSVGGAYRRSQSDMGVPLWWLERSVIYVLDARGSSDVSDGSDHAALRASFATWDEVECPDGPYPLDLVDGGLVSGRDTGFSLAGTNENLLIFRETAAEWEHSTSAIAMTLVTHDRATGRIYDADIEFNDAGFTFITHSLPLPAGSQAQDLQNTATHEIGHVVGLDHSEVPLATMWSDALPGERRKRSLAEDDIEGLCAVRPPAGAGDDDEGGGGGGCSVAPGGRVPAWGWLGALLLRR